MGTLPRILVNAPFLSMRCRNSCRSNANRGRCCGPITITGFVGLGPPLVPAHSRSNWPSNDAHCMSRQHKPGKPSCRPHVLTRTPDHFRRRGAGGSGPQRSNAGQKLQTGTARFRTINDIIMARSGLCSLHESWLVARVVDT